MHRKYPPKKHLVGQHSMTIHISEDADKDLTGYLQQLQRITGEKRTKQQFVETAINKELARVRGKNPDEVPDAPDLREIARQRRKAKNE